MPSNVTDVPGSHGPRQSGSVMVPTEVPTQMSTISFGSHFIFFAGGGLIVSSRLFDDILQLMPLFTEFVDVVDDADEDDNEDEVSDVREVVEVVFGDEEDAVEVTIVDTVLFADDDAAADAAFDDKLFVSDWLPPDEDGA